MSLSNYKQLFVGFIGVGAGLPALALFAGYPKSVCDGLGRPYEEWVKTSESKFGLYLYAVWDIALMAICGAAVVLDNDKKNTSISLTNVALGATAIHQASYLAAAIPVYGVRKEHIASMIAGAISGLWAMKK